MRNTSQNFGLIRNNSGQIIGVALGADYCAEHEWGFNWATDLGIERSINRNNYGIEARTNTKCNMNILVQKFHNKSEKVDEVALIVCNKYEDPSDYLRDASSYRMKDVSFELRAVSYKDRPVAAIRTTWSGDDGFMIIAQTPEGEEAIKIVHEALMNNRLAVGTTIDPNPFGRGGISMIDVDMMDQETKDNIKNEDLNYMDLQDEIQKTGILQRLKAAGKTYYACRGEYFQDKLMFWLNPCEQNKNNFGWFTVEDLDQWIEGKGPIPK